jgi:hypothetical protein
MVDVGLFGVTVVESLVDPEPVVVPPVVDVLAVVVVALVEEVLVLVAVSAAVAGMEAVDEVVDAVDPESSPPQPASAMVTLLNSAGQTTRPTRLTFFMRPRKKMISVSGRGGRSHLFARGWHESTQQRLGVAAQSHETVSYRPGNPAVIGSSCR